MKSYVFSAKTKEITLKFFQIKAKFTFFNRHGLRLFFVVALVPWIFQSFNQLGQNPELQAWKHEAHKEHIKKKKKINQKKKKKQTNKNIHHYIWGVQKWSKKKGSSGAKERRALTTEGYILGKWLFFEGSETWKARENQHWDDWNICYIYTHTLSNFFDFWMCFTILYCFVASRVVDVVVVTQSRPLLWKSWF